MIVLAILLLITFVIIAYFVYENRRKQSPVTEVKQENKSNDESNQTDIDENPIDYYIQPENEQSTYTDLTQPRKREDEGHVYGHLNQVPHIYTNSEETGI